MNPPTFPDFTASMDQIEMATRVMAAASYEYLTALEHVGFEHDEAITQVLLWQKSMFFKRGNHDDC